MVATFELVVVVTALVVVVVRARWAWVKTGDKTNEKTANMTKAFDIPLFLMI
jgi:hypothetical protein